MTFCSFPSSCLGMGSSKLQLPEEWSSRSLQNKGSQAGAWEPATSQNSKHRRSGMDRRNLGSMDGIDYWHPCNLDSGDPLNLDFVLSLRQNPRLITGRDAGKPCDP
jgi:hypothetical protein